MEEWVEVHGKANLRPSTFAGYRCHIKNHIAPYIGQVPLKKVTPAMIDNMIKQLYDKGLSTSTCRYAQRILSVAFEAARKYRYIDTNPARDILTKFGKDGKTPDPYTIEQMQLQHKQKELAELSGQPYYDNHLVIAKSDGSPERPDRISNNFAQFLRHQNMPHIRFHDLRHSAATNMHELTGDFYTVGEILGHTLKGIGLSLGISTNMADVTARYVDVRLERKQTVLEAYHNAMFPREAERIEQKKLNAKSRGDR